MLIDVKWLGAANTTPPDGSMVIVENGRPIFKDKAAIGIGGGGTGGASAWTDISGRPTSSVASIDDAVTKSHEHSNIVDLNKLTEDIVNGLVNQNISSTNPVLTKSNQNSIVCKAGVSISKGSLVCMSESDWKLRIPNSTVLNTVNSIVGIALNDAAIDEDVSICNCGSITNTSWNFTPGKVFLNGSGLSQTVPTEGVLICVGIALNTNTLLIRLGEPIIL